mmetsp:Transcript_17183/g.53145  ORF Transcript_17183/g.53145 Transcript_17183/m.53145 type:complete len:364 (-) Transcript_17183:1254-2345(-)
MACEQVPARPCPSALQQPGARGVPPLRSAALRHVPQAPPPRHGVHVLVLVLVLRVPTTLLVRVVAVLACHVLLRTLPVRHRAHAVAAVHGEAHGRCAAGDCACRLPVPARHGRARVAGCVAPVDDVLARDDAHDARAALDDEEVPETHGAEEAIDPPQGRVLQGHKRGLVHVGSEVHCAGHVLGREAQLVDRHRREPGPHEVVCAQLRRLRPLATLAVCKDALVEQCAKLVAQDDAEHAALAGDAWRLRGRAWPAAGRGVGRVRGGRHGEAVVVGGAQQAHERVHTLHFAHSLDRGRHDVARAHGLAVARGLVGEHGIPLEVHVEIIDAVVEEVADELGGNDGERDGYEVAHVGGRLDYDDRD